MIPRNISAPGILLRQNGAGAPEAVPAATAYGIDFQGIHCQDETGWDFFGSDEIYVITSSVHIGRDGTNVSTTVRHPVTQNGAGVYGDIDSYETRVGPTASCWYAPVADASGGVSVTTVVFEHDKGDPDAYRGQVDTIVKVALTVASYLYPGASPILGLAGVSNLVTDFFNWLLDTGDDEVGTHTTVLGLADLETYSRSCLSKFRFSKDGKRIPTELQYHFLAAANDNDYTVAFRVRRNPPVPSNPQGRIEQGGPAPTAASA